MYLVCLAWVVKLTFQMATNMDSSAWLKFDASQWEILMNLDWFPSFLLEKIEPRVWFDRDRQEI